MLRDEIYNFFLLSFSNLTSKKSTANTCKCVNVFILYFAINTFVTCHRDKKSQVANKNVTEL